MGSPSHFGMFVFASPWHEIEHCVMLVATRWPPRPVPPRIPTAYRAIDRVIFELAWWKYRGGYLYVMRDAEFPATTTHGYRTSAARRRPWGPEYFPALTALALRCELLGSLEAVPAGP